MLADQLRLEPYRAEHRRRWNDFVAASKNGTFLFDRGFMEYHADRFEDGSLLAFEGEDNLVALLPANRTADALVSHGGLTYGGWVTDARMTTPSMLALFDLLVARLAAEGVERLRYKAVPRCYHRLPADEDLYALHVNGAQTVRLDVSSVIDLAHAPGWSKGRRHSLSKARRADLRVERSMDFAELVASLHEVLARHDAAPVHSAEELELLAERFPDQVVLWRACEGAQAVAHVLVFDCGATVHTQYMASREQGRAAGGLEAILHHLQHHAYAERRYLSFGTSLQPDGRSLNLGLIAQKEMFGGRAMVAPTYELRAPADVSGRRIAAPTGSRGEPAR